MKKILIVTPYKEKIGGVEIATHNLTNVLTKNQFEVNWLTLDNYKKNKLEQWITKFIGDQYLTYKLAKKIDLSIYSAIICNGEFSFGIKHKKIVNVFHGSYLGYRDSRSYLNLFQYLNLTLKSKLQAWSSKNKSVVAVSHFLSGILKKQKIKVSKIILNFVDVNHFNFLDKEKEADFVFMTRYDYFGKGIDHLEKLADVGMEIHCFSDQKNESKIVWHQRVPNNQVVIELNKFKIFISPSRFEACSMAVLEAMSCGLPVLISRTGSYIEIEKIIPEFIVDDFENYLEVKNKAENILSNYEYYSKKARDFILENASEVAYTKKWLEVLND